ncbi:hypothetical protein VPH35_063738 [Triticum aestivum]
MSPKTQAPEQQQLMAFWASLLLDTELWLRHLFTLVVQAVGAAYVLYKYVAGGSGALLAAAVLMFLVGAGKYLERVFALYSSGLENISKFLDRAEIPRYPCDAPRDLFDAEESLRRAHDTLHVSMGQLVDYKVWPCKLLEIVRMQLSLTRDILYTKVAAFNWFHHQSTMVRSGYSKGDMFVSLLRASMSTWTCDCLRATEWERLGDVVVYLRRGVRAARGCRSWPGIFAQHDMFRFCKEGRNGACYAVAHLFRLDHWLNKLRFFNSVVISHEVEAELLHHINCMVEACEEEEHILWDYRGQLALKAWGSTFYDDVIDDIHAIGLDGSSLDASKVAFHGSILTWHYAVKDYRRHELKDLARVTNMAHWVRFMNFQLQESKNELGHLVQGIRMLSRYMVFLLLEWPHLLPSPVRRIQDDSFCLGCKEFRINQRLPWIIQGLSNHTNTTPRFVNEIHRYGYIPGPLFLPVFGVRVEVLCFAATHRSNDAHARQLGSGTENHGCVASDDHLLHSSLP